MRRLDPQTRVAILRCLVEGNSILATCRMTGAAKNTVIKLLVDAGGAASDFCDVALRDLGSRRVECDEIWSFVGAKQKNAQGRDGMGDIWTWTAIDAESKLAITWRVGDRSSATAVAFMDDLASRLKNRVQISTDGNSSYIDAVEIAFGANVDYGMILKEYGTPSEAVEAHRRYSPASVSSVEKRTITGTPNKDKISTSYVERQNLTMRMGIRRFTRLTNAFSKKAENHAAAVALHFWWYNFGRVHKTLRVTPAMAAGVVDHVLDLDHLIGFMADSEATAVDVAKKRKDRKPVGG